MKLFSTLIHWPEQILSSIEASKDKLNNQKDQAEIDLMKRCLNTDTHIKRNIHGVNKPDGYHMLYFQSREVGGDAEGTGQRGGHL